MIPHTCNHDSNGRGWTKLIARTELESENFLTNNVLNILCLIETSTVVNNNNSRITKNLELAESCCFGEVDNILEIMYEDQSYSDVTFIVQSKELKAHKNVLAAASPIFSTMFKENSNKNVEHLEILDMSYEVVKEMFRFIYTKKIEFLHDIAHELILAAHKYCIPGLKKVCEESLCKNITLENALELLKISDFYNAKCLKDFAVGFIMENKKHFADDGEFKELANSNPMLLQPLLFSMVS